MDPHAPLEGWGTDADADLLALLATAVDGGEGEGGAGHGDPGLQASLADHGLTQGLKERFNLSV